jgi:hypothetical protein
MSDESTAENPRFNDTRRAAERYLRAGLAVIPLAAGEKNPNRQGWQRERHTMEDIPKCWNNGQNIGVLTGEPSGWLVDIDLDCPEALKIAGRFLDPTLTSGRESTPDCHWWYWAEGIRSKTFDDLGGPEAETLLEIRSNGHQTVVAPSLHPSGERYIWSQSGLEFATVTAETLLRSVRELATAALVARVLPKGGRHRFGLALAGFLLRRELEPESVGKIMHAAWDAAGFASERARSEAHADIEAIVRDTVEDLEEGTEISGGGVLDELARGLPHKISRYWGWSSRITEAEVRRPVEASDLPQIVVNDRPLRDVGDEALQALEARNKPPKLFAQAGKVIRLGQDENDGPIIQEAGEGVIRHHLTRAANFVHERERRSGTEQGHVHPPKDVVHDVMSVPHLPFPPLLGVPRTPFFRSDGTIVSESGYDAATKLYYVPDREAFAVEVPEKPTTEDLSAAVALLDEAAGDFPYRDKASAANTLALLLTPILRNVIEGPVPLALIDKPTPGTGGSLLAEAVSLIATGSPAGMMSAPRDDEEVRKQITSALIRGNLVITLDNVDGVLHAPSLSRALTSEFWEDRVLGRSEIIRVPQRATWMVSGNNLQVGGDLPRRSYWIRLDARVERPWERKGFRHPNLKVWVAENRARLVSALLTMSKAWFVEGKPKGSAVIGSYEHWAHIIGGVLDVASVPGFLNNRDEMYERAADGTRDWAVFLEAWRKIYGDEARTTKQVAADLHEEANKGFREALPDEFGTIVPDRPDKGLSRTLGKAFAKREGRRLGTESLHLVRAGSKNNATQWAVHPAPDGPAEVISLISLISSPPPSRARPREGDDEPGLTKDTNKLIPSPHTSSNEEGASTSKSATSGSEPDERSPSVAELFANPPSWLPGQLKVYREDPERHFKPLCSTVAAVVLGDPLRGDEVAEEVRKEVGACPRERLKTIKLYTSYWNKPCLKKLPLDRVLKIGISRWCPDWGVKHVSLAEEPFAPPPHLLGAWKESEKTPEDERRFEKGYRERLDAYGIDAIRERLEEVMGSADVAILLCYEKDKFCHRRVFADWYQEQTGEVIEEIA